MRAVATEAKRSEEISPRAHAAGHAAAAHRQDVMLQAPLVLQRTPGCACGGGCPRCRGGAPASRYTVNTPGDRYEQEADRVAEQVMRMPDPQAVSAPEPLTAPQVAPARTAAPAIQRACASCGGGVPEEEAGEIQAKEEPGQVPRVSSDVQGRIDSLRGGGEPLPASVRSYFEPRFGRDFSGVRVHTDARAADTARSVSALAYTIGNDVVFGAGQYAPESHTGRHLLAHELTHVVQQSEQPTLRRMIQRVVGGAPGSGGSGAVNAPGVMARPGVRGIEVDVLAAEGAEEFLTRHAANDIGADIRVSSMDDMIGQLERMSSGGTCIARLNIYNHGNPGIQTVSGGNKIKSPTGEQSRQPLSGFDQNWLLNNANQASLNRLRHSLCCGAAMNWYGCSTAGVIAPDGTRTAAEIGESERRYQMFGSFYQSIDDAAAHGAVQFRDIGMVNVQGWSNALCTPVAASTDFTNWTTTSSGGGTRTVIYGGRQIVVQPQADIPCACDPATGRLAGAAPTRDQLQQRAVELREGYLRPTYDRARAAIATPQAARAESDAERASREATEQAQATASENLGNTIRDAVLTRAGFAAGTRPASADEALRVTALWGVSIDQIVGAMPTMTASLSGMLRGRQEATGLDQRQRDLEAALTPRGRENFMAALLKVRRERFWNEHLLHNTIYIFPDLTGVNRFRGYTQSSTAQDDQGRRQTVHVIHISKDMLQAEGMVDLVTANLVHELSHTIYDQNISGRAMQGFTTDLATLISDHPRLVQLRAGAADAASARSAQIMRLRQMLYEVTGYAEEEIFVHLQQLTNQPSMTIDGTAVSGSDFILSQLTLYIGRLLRIGIPNRILADILRTVRQRAMELYDRRIAAAPEGSSDRRTLEVNKQLAILLMQMALDNAQHPPSP